MRVGADADQGLGYRCSWVLSSYFAASQLKGGTVSAQLFSDRLTHLPSFPCRYAMLSFERRHHHLTLPLPHVLILICYAA